MDESLRERLLSLPPLDIGNARIQALPCKICQDKAAPFDIVDFNKCASTQDVYRYGWAGVAISYYRCRSCGFLFTDYFDAWNHTDFFAFIYNDDYVKVDGDYLGVRARRVAPVMRGLLEGCQSARILDYGSGMGLFAQALADLNFPLAASYDPYSSPGRPEGKFDIITCFEVIEHSTDPVGVFEDMKSLLRDGGVIVFSQSIQPADIMLQRCNWWYVAPRNGHVSIHTLESLAEIACRLGFRLWQNGNNFFAAVLDNPSTYSSLVAKRVGLPYFSAILHAPAKGPADEAWFPIEKGRQFFRWTRAREIPWRLTFPAGVPLRLKIRIPVVNQIVPDFARNCAITVDGHEWPLRFEDGVLTAQDTVCPGDVTEIILHTPALTSPAQLGTSIDKRELGMAIAAAASGEEGQRANGLRPSV